MSSLVKVASNLFMPSEDSFGIYNREIVHRLLVNIQNNFSLLLEQPIDTSVYYFIDYRPGNPECCKIPNGFLIFLSSREDEFWRWVFQFSHEYCHSLINGTLSGEIYGLLWFEETICHLSSIYQLNNLIELCDKSSNSLLHCYKEVAHLHLLGNFGQPQYNCREYLLSEAGRLAEPEYHREIYSNLAATMFPLFVEHPALWKIILHFGDTRQWKTLEELFDHLHSKADESYALPLQKLQNLLLS